MTPQQINTLRERFLSEKCIRNSLGIDITEKIFEWFISQPELKEERGDYVASQVQSPASVVSHSCTDGNSIQQEGGQIDYKAKYEKCINVISRFDAGIIGMYDL